MNIASAASVKHVSLDKFCSLITVLCFLAVLVKKHFLHRDLSGSDLEKVVKSRSRILNEGLGGSRILPFYTPFTASWPDLAMS